MKLTAEQDRAVGLMQQHFLRGSAAQPLVVRGWAGTGKTTLTAYALEGYMARLAEDPEAVDGPGDRTFDPPVVWSKSC
jgi:hypothetical protein